MNNAYFSSCVADNLIQTTEWQEDPGKIRIQKRHKDGNEVPQLGTMKNNALSLVGVFLLSTLPCNMLSLRRQIGFGQKRVPCLFHPQGCALAASTMGQEVQRDELVQNLLSACRRVGQVGALASQEERDEINDLAKQLVPHSDPQPAREPLTGLHTLVYSASESPASGRIVGPFYGHVTQEFVDKDTYINRVEFMGFKGEVLAKKKVLDDTSIQVDFKRSSIYLFGKQVVDKELSMSGVWKYLFYGKVKDEDEIVKLIRVMETPSLFVIEQPVQTEPKS